jgi:uncharacterized membrane protein
MTFLFVLLAAFALLWLVPFPRGRRRPVRTAARIAMGVAFVVAGIGHVATPTPFVQHLPSWVPERHALIYLTGLLEVVGGVALIALRAWRWPIGVLIALYLVAVFPANVYVAVAGVAVDGLPGGVYPWLRLLLQPVFIAWTLWSAAPATTTGTDAHAEQLRPAA